MLKETTPACLHPSALYFVCFPNHHPPRSSIVRAMSSCVYVAGLPISPGLPSACCVTCCTAAVSQSPRRRWGH